MPNSPWTETAASISLVPVTTTIDPGSSAENVNYLTNSDKIALMSQYSAELAMKTELDTAASGVAISSATYDNAVAAISTTLTSAGAPANWATAWPDGTTSGPWTGIQTSLANDWATVASARATLQTQISSAQAEQAQQAAITAAATDATTKANNAITAAESYSDAATALATPAVVSALPTLPNSAYPSGKYVWVTTTNQLYVNNAGTWEALAVPATQVTGTLVAGQIAAGAIGAEQIAADAITTASLVIANFNNLVANGNSETAAPAGGWPAGAYEGVCLSTTNPYQGTYCRRYTSNTTGSTQLLARVAAFPASAGEQYLYEAMVSADAGVTGVIVLAAYDASGAYLGQANATFTSATYAALSCQLTCPANTATVNVWIGTDDITTAGTGACFDNLCCRRMADANLIVDGCIDATKIAADTIDASKIVTSGLTVGGSASVPISLMAVDASSNPVAAIGQLGTQGAPVDSAWGTPYGIWAKNLAVGGSEAAPSLWVDNSGNLLGNNGTCVDLHGNLGFKNLVGVSGTTQSPTVSTTGFADLPELGTGNAQMTVVTKGNPALLSMNLSYYAATGSATSGPVSGIGVTFTSRSSSPAPTITISISGDGTGAAAYVTWTSAGGYLWPTLTIVGGTGYTTATATVTITNGNVYYPNSGPTAYTCTINMGQPIAGVSIASQVLMDGSPILGPLSVISDAAGNAHAQSTMLVAVPAGSHAFEVQAYNKSADLVQSINRSFMLIELG